MSWWQLLLLCWFCYVAGLFSAALMVAARGDQFDDTKRSPTDD